jgi:hypothetical protein
VKKEKKEGDQGEDRNKKSLLIIDDDDDDDDDDDVDITNSFNLALEDSGLFVVGTYIEV